MTMRTVFVTLASTAFLPQAMPAETVLSANVAGAVPEEARARNFKFDGKGVKVTAPNGATVEFWIRDLVPSGAAPEGPDVAFEKIPHGALIGVVRVTGKFNDRRGYAVPEGVYGLRYTLYPNEPNHYYVAPQRDFLVLTDLRLDADADRNLAFAEILKVSQKAASSNHPLCLGLSAVSGREPIDKLANEDWVLRVRVEGEEIGVIVFGRSEG